jgi:hypothetical protein
VLALRPPVEVTVVCRAADGSALPPDVTSSAYLGLSERVPADAPHRHRGRVPRFPEEITVEASATGFVTNRVSWSPPDSGGEIEIRLGRAVRVTGRLVGEFDWIAMDRWIWVSHESAEFVFHVAPGATALLGAGKGPVPGFIRRIEVPLRGDLHLGDVPLEPPVLAKGFVIDEGGDPIGGAVVTATSPWRDWKVTTRGDGSFTIPLPRTDLVRVEVEKGLLYAAIPVAALLKGPQTIRLGAPER